MVAIADTFNLQRFIDAQNDTFDTAMQELREGRKRTHCIWFIFPQMRGMGYNYNSKYYGISGIEEAKEYLENESLGRNLWLVTQELLRAADRNAIVDVLERIDTIKVHSSMTLFDAVSPDNVFERVLDKCFGGERDGNTLRLLKEVQN